MFGNHIHRNGKRPAEAIQKDIQRAQELGISMKSAQLFVIGPYNAKETLNPDDKQKLAAQDTKLIVHCSYLSNPWGSKPGFGVHLIKAELKICDEIGAEGLVVHLSKRAPEEIISQLPKLFEESPKCKIFLEIESYKPNECTYETPEKLANLFKLIEQHSPELLPQLGVCIDIAHAWAANVDISTHSAMKKYLNNILKISQLHPNDIIFHLNDQKWMLGSGRDEHAPLGYGTIWKEWGVDSDFTSMEETGLSALVEFAIKHNSIVILERKEDKPKINNLPICDNITADYVVLNNLGVK